jgi:hypothetical protein
MAAIKRDLLMPTLSDSWIRIWNNVRGRATTVKRGIRIPAARVTGESPSGGFDPGKHYFSVIINEMFLSNSRQWFNIYDPMVLVVTEFTYDGDKKIVPFVVGPSLVASSVGRVPAGFQITNTKVAGIHPYAGGSFALTVVLAQVKQASIAKNLLGFVETVSKAFPAGAALTPYLKVAGAVLSGVESLLGMDDTTPLIGHRWEYNHEEEAQLQPGYFALVDDDLTAPSLSMLGVNENCLMTGHDTAPYRGKDFVLYKLARSLRRDDAPELPFHGLFQAALRDAASADDGAWDRARAGLVTLYREILTSPDLTWDQGQELMKTFKERVVAAHRQAGTLSPTKGRGATRLLEDLLDARRMPSIDRSAKAETFGKVHELLRL